MKLCRWEARGVASAQGGRLHEWVGWWEALLELSFTPGKGKRSQSGRLLSLRNEHTISFLNLFYKARPPWHFSTPLSFSNCPGNIVRLESVGRVQCSGLVRETLIFPPSCD